MQLTGQTITAFKDVRVLTKRLEKLLITMLHHIVQINIQMVMCVVHITMSELIKNEVKINN